MDLRREIQLEAASPVETFVIVSAGVTGGLLVFYRPNECGYTTQVENAGLYSREKAAKIQNFALRYHRSEMAVPTSVIHENAHRAVSSDLMSKVLFHALTPAEVRNA